MSESCLEFLPSYFPEFDVPIEATSVNKVMQLEEMTITNIASTLGVAPKVLSITQVVNGDKLPVSRNYVVEMEVTHPLVGLNNRDHRGTLTTMVKVLHNAGIIHSNIKELNIVVNTNRSIRLTDYSDAKFIEKVPFCAINQFKEWDLAMVNTVVQNR
jgi:serine/threonine protein kinase